MKQYTVTRGHMDASSVASVLDRKTISTFMKKESILKKDLIHAATVKDHLL